MVYGIWYMVRGTWYMRVNRDMIDDTMSGEDGSVSSRMSNKSEKNMADFDGEDSVCDEDLLQLAAHAQVRQNFYLALRINTRIREYATQFAIRTYFVLRRI